MSRASISCLFAPDDKGTLGIQLGDGLVFTQGAQRLRRGTLIPHVGAPRDAGTVVDDTGAQPVDPPRTNETPGAPFVPLDAGPCELHVIEPTPAEVAAQAVSCSYALPAPGVYLPQGMLISVDGTRRARDDRADGWLLSDDMRTVVSLGAACDEVRAGKAWEVTVLCRTLPVI